MFWHYNDKTKTYSKSVDPSKYPINTLDAPEELVDLTSLPHLHTPALLHSLSLRYELDHIYTLTGPILIAINPFKIIPELYSVQAISDHYVFDLSFGAMSDAGNKPHVYQIANNAYRGLLDSEQDQSILISGESGAGKTESTKHVMNFLATVSSPGSDLTSGTTTEKGTIAERVLGSNIILEAFGNARTTRNDNSSRFGKFIRLKFNGRNLVGANIETYLLEKSRINGQVFSERNYHIFYLLLKGSLDKIQGLEELVDKLGMLKKTTVGLLSNGLIKRNDGVEDSKQFLKLMDAMETMNFSKENIKSILSLVVGVMLFSNISYETNGDASKLKRDDVATSVAKFLGVDTDSLERVLTKRKLTVGMEEFVKDLNVHQAVGAKDALIKSIYSNLFNYIVAEINTQIQPRDSASQFSSEGSISVLDIFGFEVFETNGFEQLLINYTNEALQQQFNQYVFKHEQALYKREEIPWSQVDFDDNQEVLNLIQGRMSILSLLDEHCKLNSDDKKYISNVYDKLKIDVTPSQKAAGQFTINHFAGSVTYSSQDWIDKNRNILFLEAIDVLAQSSNDLVCDLYKREQSIAAASASVSSQGGSPSKAKTKAANTVSGEFKGQLSDLLYVIGKTAPHYIRCLKPNDENKPEKLDRPRLLDQLNYSGVLQAVEIARRGFPVRMKHEEFAARYKMVGLSVEEILLKIDKEVLGYEIGKTLVFLKKETHEELEKLRDEYRTLKAIFIQKNLRMAVARNSYQRKRKAVILIQSIYRMQCARIELNALRRNAAATRIQTFTRCNLRRKEFQKKKELVIKLQSLFRMYRIRNIFIEHFHNSRATKIQSVVRSWLAFVKYQRVQLMVVWVQKRVRGMLARKNLKILKRDMRKVETLQQKLDKAQNEIIKLRKESKELKSELIITKEKLAEREIETEVQEVEDQEKEMLRDELIAQKSANNKLVEQVAKLKLELNEEKATHTSDMVYKKQENGLLEEKQEETSVEMSEEEKLKNEREYYFNRMDSGDGESVNEFNDSATKEDAEIIRIDENQQRLYDEQQKAVEELALENAELKKENGDAKEKLNGYISRMCEAENRANESETRIKELADDVEVLKNKLSSMNLMAEQASTVKIALAKRVEELILERKAFSKEGKILKEKVKYYQDMNKTLTEKVSNFKKSQRLT
eukprot:augustus_masked-scaffold_5-processed-gene-6.34-mRNA-1 protein AED:0.10 eAED:0.10 QI:0/-1/0/1/-1/1/1/0/1165